MPTDIVKGLFPAYAEAAAKAKLAQNDNDKITFFVGELVGVEIYPATGQSQPNRHYELYTIATSDSQRISVLSDNHAFFSEADIGKIIWAEVTYEQRTGNDNQYCIQKAGVFSPDRIAQLLEAE